jgi:hypothetical protein
MSESTSISELPTDPVGGGNISNNISLNASETIPVQQQQAPGGLNLDQNTINQIVSGLQQASQTGATQLPSRDIPMIPTDLSNDPQVQPNYVPSPQNNVDYIKNIEQTSDMIDSYNRSSKQQGSLDDIYNEIQTPVLLAVLYFLFQLPFFKKFLFNYFPILYSNDGNLNLNGFVFTSAIFGVLFYTFNKVVTTFGTF